MFCPKGFHLIHEIELMVENITEAKLPWSPSEKAVNLAEKEQYSELDAYEIKWSHAKKHVTPKHPSGYRVLGSTRDFRSER